MRRIVHLGITMAIFISVAGCATGPQLIVNNAYNYKTSRVFNSDFNSTWSAVIKVMEAYPIVTIEKDSGILITDWVQGSSPLYMRKVFIPLTQRKTKRAIGIYCTQLTPNVVYIVYVLKNSPAYQAGVRAQDIVVSCNGKRVKKAIELARCCSESDTVNLVVLRYGSNKPLKLHVKPKKMRFGYTYIPVKTRYKLNIRVSKISETKTEVKVINYEEADFGHQTQYGWQPNYQVISTSTLREKILLDAIEKELNNKSPSGHYGVRS